MRPPVSDRLKDLQRQRALAQEQLAWLDREIARESGTTPPAATPAPVIAPSPAPNADLDHDAQKLIDKYRPAKPVKEEVRRGCLIYFFAAFALLVAILVAVYFLNPR